MLNQPVRPSSERAHCQVNPLMLPSPSEECGVHLDVDPRLVVGERDDARLLDVRDGDGDRTGDVDHGDRFDVAVLVLAVMQGDVQEQASCASLKVQRLDGPQLPGGRVDLEQIAGSSVLETPCQGVAVAVLGRQGDTDVLVGGGLRDVLRASLPEGEPGGRVDDRVGGDCRGRFALRRLARASAVDIRNDSANLVVGLVLIQQVLIGRGKSMGRGDRLPGSPGQQTSFDIPGDRRRIPDNRRGDIDPTVRVCQREHDPVAHRRIQVVHLDNAGLLQVGHGDGDFGRRGEARRPAEDVGSDHGELVDVAVNICAVALRACRHLVAGSIGKRDRYRRCRWRSRRCRRR